MADTASASNEDNVAVDSPQLHEEGSINKSLLSVLSSMQENLVSSNSMLRDLVNRKRKSSETVPISKRAKLDSEDSSHLTHASEKAQNTTSQEVNDNASEEETDPASEEAHAKTPDDDAISLFSGEDSQNELQLEDEEVNNDDLLSEITTSLSSSDEAGPPVSDKLSKLVNDKFQTEYTVEKRKEIVQKYKVPSNCHELYVPKVNSEIWGKLNANSKRSDIRTSVLQDTLVKVSGAIIVTVDDLLSHREKKTTPDYKALISRLTDSVALIGHVHKELSFKRRDAIRPYLNQEFKQACSRTLKPGKLLFGEDLPKTLQELKTTNKLMSSVTPDNKRGHAKSKNHSNNQFRGRYFQGNQSKPFLASRGGNAYPPKSNQQQNQFQHKKRFTKS